MLTHGMCVCACVLVFARLQALGWHNALDILGTFKYSGHILIVLCYIPVGFFKAPKPAATTADAKKTDKKNE